MNEVFIKTLDNGTIDINLAINGQLFIQLGNSSNEKDIIRFLGMDNLYPILYKLDFFLYEYITQAIHNEGIYYKDEFIKYILYEFHIYCENQKLSCISYNSEEDAEKMIKHLPAVKKGSLLIKECYVQRNDKICTFMNL